MPISVWRTWPVMQTSGVESMRASAMGVTRLVAPGPEVAIDDAGAAAGAGIALRHVTRALLVAGEHVAHRGAARERVVERQDGAAGHAEADGDGLALEARARSRRRR